MNIKKYIRVVNHSKARVDEGDETLVMKGDTYRVEGITS